MTTVGRALPADQCIKTLGLWSHRYCGTTQPVLTDAGSCAEGRVIESQSKGFWSEKELMRSSTALKVQLGERVTRLSPRARRMSPEHRRPCSPDLPDLGYPGVRLALGVDGKPVGHHGQG